MHLQVKNVKPDINHQVYGAVAGDQAFASHLGGYGELESMTRSHSLTMLPLKPSLETLLVDNHSESY